MHASSTSDQRALPPIRVASVLAILHPFRDISGHIVETERVCREVADVKRLHSGACLAVAAICLASTNSSAPVERSLRTPPCRIFPFGLTREPVGLAGLLCQPRNIFFRVEPADIDHRMVPAPPAVIIWFEPAAPGFDAQVPTIKSDLVSTECKLLPDCHAMQWPI